MNKLRNEQIEEGNALIALFMGWKLYTPKLTGLLSLFNKYDSECYTLNSHTRAFLPDQMAYHHSWDWLMPVGKKCMDLATEQPGRPTVNHCSKLDWIECQISMHVREYELHDAWLQIVEFIKLYNSKQYV